MGVVMQRAGGGKVTVEGLEPGALKRGATATVKQGSKVIKEVIGTFLGEYTYLAHRFSATDNGANSIWTIPAGAKRLLLFSMEYPNYSQSFTAYPDTSIVLASWDSSKGCIFAEVDIPEGVTQVKLSFTSAGSSGRVCSLVAYK